MIGGVATEERELNESKKEGRGCVGSPRMMVSTFRISRTLMMMSPHVRAHARLLNSAVEVSGVYKRGGIRADRLRSKLPREAARF